MKCVSLFSGCGGLDLGLHQAGFEIALANDLDVRCAQSHALNFPETAFYHGSVSTLFDSPDFKRIEKQQNIDLLAGGPPCPPFSKSRFYRKDKPRALDDPTGHETINGYLDALERLQPRAFLLENVPGFSYKVHRDAFDHVVSRANALGYDVTWRIVNAADYGVPQIRQRFMMVGTRDSTFTWPEPTHANPEEGTIPADKAPWATAGHAISDLDTEENASDDGHFAGGRHHDLLCQVPPGENYLFFTKERGHQEPKFKWRSRYWSFLLKLSPELPAWTIQARRSNNMGPFHWRNRILRISEVKRLQTFPDSWHLVGTTEQQWRQVGNAVPPLLAQAVGERIRDALAMKAKPKRQARIDRYAR